LLLPSRGKGFDQNHQRATQKEEISRYKGQKGGVIDIKSEHHNKSAELATVNAIVGSPNSVIG